MLILLCIRAIRPTGVSFVPMGSHVWLLAKRGYWVSGGCRIILSVVYSVGF